MKLCFIALLFISFSGFSKTYFIAKKVNASSFIAKYKVDTTEYNLQWRIIQNQNNDLNILTNNKNGFRIICDNDSVYFSFYTNIDSVKFILKPNDTVYFSVLLENSKLATVKIIGYDKSENYSDTYIKENTNAITIDIPEVSELVKIILMLNQDELSYGVSAKFNSNVGVYNSKYYKDFIDFFYKFKNEPIVTILKDFIKDESYIIERENYLNIKKFATLYEFTKANTIVRSKYYVVEAGINYDMLEPYLIQLVDFANKTNFRTFYKNHLSNYKEIEDLYLKLVPVNSLWNFTEMHFKKRVQHYKIIFSPLENNNYVRAINYNKNQHFNQYIYYTTTPFWAINNNKNTIENNYVYNSYDFFREQLIQYMEDDYLTDTLSLNNLFKKKNNWIYINTFDKKNKIPSSYIFYSYVVNALFDQYYTSVIKPKFDGTNKIDFYKKLLKSDSFNAQFSILYKKYGYNEFEKVLAEMQEWCKKQK